MKRTGLVLVGASALVACAAPSTQISAGLRRYGLEPARADCIGERLQSDLSLGQLRQLGRAAAAYRTGDTDPTTLTAGAVDSRDWQVDGVVNQVAGGAQHAYGRVRSMIEDAVESAPALADHARETLADAGRRAGRVAQRGGASAADAVRGQPILWALIAAAGGYTLARLVHCSRG